MRDAAGGPAVEKARQADVHYRPASRERRCGACVSFRIDPPGTTCERVEGPVSPAMCCDLWRPLKHGAPPADAGSGGTGGGSPVA